MSTFSERGRYDARLLSAALLVLSGLAVAYWDVARRLVSDWSSNESYSHGFLIVPIAAYLVWERRTRLAAVERRPANSGLALIAVGLLALAAGTLGAELFVARTSLILVLAGIVAFVGGWAHLRILAFPIAFLLLMIPIPSIVFNQIAFPLQLLASRFGEAALWAADIPVLRQGNVMTLANTTLEVAEACSGIRSLVSLLTLSILYGYFLEQRTAIRVILTVATVPIAIFTNGLRVAAIGIAAYYRGVSATEGAFHDASGWLVFVVAFAMLLAVHHLCRAFQSRTRLLWQRAVPAN